MKTICLSLVPMLFLTSLCAEPVVTLAGIRSVMDDGEKEFDGFKTYNSDEGTGVALIVRSGDKEIVGFDDDAAALKIGGAEASCRFFGNMAFSKDRRALRLEFDAEDKPQRSPDGTIKVTGELPLTLATGKEETRSEPLKVANGASVKFPADAKDLPTLKVKSSGKPKWGDDAFEIEFSLNRKPDEIAGIRFYTKDGKEVKADRTSSGWMGFGNKGSGEITYSFKAAHEELVIGLENWTGSEQVSLKVDLDAGL